MKKVAISFIVLGSSFILGSNLVSATSEEVMYDLTNHHFIETFEIEEEGEIVDVTVIALEKINQFTFQIVVAKMKSAFPLINYLLLLDSYHFFLQFVLVPFLIVQFFYLLATLKFVVDPIIFEGFFGY